MEKIFQSVALIQATDNRKTRLLVRGNRTAGGWQFIVGERLGTESFRETTIREVAWQLDLDPAKDFIVSKMAQLSVEWFETVPGEDCESHIAVAFYPVHIYRRGVLEELQADPCNRWVSTAEICAGQTRDRRPIHPTVVNWINKWEILQPWHP